MTLHILGEEWKFDDDCDCPMCEDWRDGHCPNCGEPFKWLGLEAR